MPAPDLPLLLSAAEAAGEVAMRFWRRDPQVWDKGAEGPVSEADLAVNALLADRLRAARPEYGWLSEEGPDDPGRAAAARVFILDPIDGTRAFIAGENAWAVALAVAEAGQVTAGVIHLPACGLTYAAAAGRGATLNGRPIRRPEPEGAVRMLVSKAALAPQHWPGGVPEVTRVFRPALAWRLARVAEAQEEAMLTLGPTWEWDAAAGALIAAEAGAVVTDSRGAPLRFNQPHPRIADGVLAAPPGLHADLAARRRGTS